MRRVLVVFVLILVVAVTGVAYAGIQADFSKSYSEVLDSQTLRIRHITNVVQDGVPLEGEFWADVVWDQHKIAFAPNWNVGQEQVTSQDIASKFTGTWQGSLSDFGGQTWALTFNFAADLNGSFTAGDGTVNISGNLLNDTLSFKLPLFGREGDPDCIRWDVNCSATLFQDKSLETQDSSLMFMTCSGTWCGKGGGKVLSFSAPLEKQ